MHLTNRLRIPLVLSVLLYCNVGNLYAQKVDLTAQITHVADSLCKEIAPTFSQVEGVRDLVIKHPIDYEKVCSCAQANFVKDSRLREFLKTASNDTKQRLNTDELSSYVAVRVMSSMLACIATELDATLAQTDLLN
jgi:hypothetical protein